MLSYKFTRCVFWNKNNFNCFISTRHFDWGCTHRSSELPPSQRSSQITASDILSLERDPLQDYNLPKGDVSTAYLSDYVPDDPSGHQNFEYVNKEDLSFLCTTTFAENEDHIFVVIVNNETNESLRLSKEESRELYEQLLNSRGAKPTKLTIRDDLINPQYTGGLSDKNK